MIAFYFFFYADIYKLIPQDGAGDEMREYLHRENRNGWEEVELIGIVLV